MSQFESQFDCILIGTGNSGKAAVELLKEKGKNAFYIELKPEMVATLISQQAVGQTTESGNPSSQTKVHENGELYLKKQTLHTANLETNTYTLQVKPVENHAYQQTDSFYDESSQAHQSSSTKDTEVLEAQQVEYPTPPYSFFTSRGPLRKKTLRRKQKLHFQEQPEPNEEYPVYHLERVQLGEEEESGNHGDDLWNSPFNKHDHEKKSEETYLEREQKPRSQQTGNQWMIPSNQESDDSPVKTDNPSYSSSTFGQTSDSFTNSFPDFYSNGFDTESETNHQPDFSYKPGEQPKSQSNELVPFEPFSPRRRARHGKRARFQQKRESLAEKAIPSVKENQQPSENHSMRLSNEPANKEKHPLFPSGQPEMQPFGKEEDDNKTPYPDSSFKTTENDESTSSLKRDDIEFEDAYGGYSSWEEIMTPFSQNNRKRQEIDKIEKRKIALRGLHNLINNMG